MTRIHFLFYAESITKTFSSKDNDIYVIRKGSTFDRICFIVGFSASCVRLVCFLFVNKTTKKKKKNTDSRVKILRKGVYIPCQFVAN